MRCLLIYFTGTFNTRYVSQQLKQKLELVGYDVDLYEIDPLNTERLDLSGSDLIGLGYPIYGYNAPWPFLKFIRKQKFPKGIRTFIYKNSGETEKACLGVTFEDGDEIADEVLVHDPDIVMQVDLILGIR